MLQRILNRLFNHFDIVSGGDLYLRRWRLVRLGPLRLNLHYIRRSDADRELHDHPWDFTSIILAGGYTEETFSDDCHPKEPGVYKVKAHYGVGSILHRKAEFAHRLDLDKPAWTLVFLGKHRRKWGFWTHDRQWVYWRDFLGVPDNGKEEAEFQ